MMVRVRVAALIAVFLAAPVCAGHARADWFFGLFGSSEPEPAPRPDAVSYKVEIEVTAVIP